MPGSPLRLFQGFGVELEYMIVDSRTQAVKPIADQLLKVNGTYVSEVEHDRLAWSNELVLHVIEFKTNGPVLTLRGLARVFQDHVREVCKLLAPLGARLMPTAMHPTMDPFRETVLWPHEFNEVYAGFNRIFDCSGHGWANLQSTHVNLPFKDDEEFARLHSAIRLVLPLIPALAASSPLADGQVKSWLDTRMETYRLNAVRMPSVTGLVVPEAVASRTDYQKYILDPMYADLAPFDPEGVLRYEWANARGAIARFDRSTIEIRVIDVQECPVADLAITAAIVAVVKALALGDTPSLEAQMKLDTEQLAEILLSTIRHADEAVIEDRAYLSALGLSPAEPFRAGRLWRELIERHGSGPDGLSEWSATLETILNEGCLARRILRRLGEDTSAHCIYAVYDELCDCLAEGEMFHGRS